MKRAALALLVSLAVVGAPACRKAGDPVRETIDALAGAASERDADAAEKLLAAGYADGEHPDRNAAVLTIRRYFAAYERISVSLADVTIERKPDLARATFVASFDGAPRKLGALDAMLPRTSKVRFEMNLVPEEGRWKVAWAGWQLVSEGSGP